MVNTRRRPLRRPLTRHPVLKPHFNIYGSEDLTLKLHLLDGYDGTIACIKPSRGLRHSKFSIDSRGLDDTALHWTDNTYAH